MTVMLRKFMTSMMITILMLSTVPLGAWAEDAEELPPVKSFGGSVILPDNSPPP